MMKKTIISALLLMTAGLQTAKAQKVILYPTDGEKVVFDAQQVDSIIFVPGDTSHGITDGHEWVDLGLPSGTLWATCNIGADCPEGYGTYFAWGETSPRNSYVWNTYTWMVDTYEGRQTNTYNDGDHKYISKYTIDDNRTDACWYDSEGNFIGDGLTELLPEDDAATVNWGENWQMPSNDQQEELMNPEFTKAEWTTQNDVIGCLLTSLTNGNTLFLPAAGSYFKSSLEGRGTPASLGYMVYYWSRTLQHFNEANGTQKTTKLARIIYCTTRRSVVSSAERYHGMNIRPVRKK